jgi:hypothetical protein
MRLDTLTRWLQVPLQPTPADIAYAAWAESIELVMVAIYNEVMPKLTADNLATAARFRDHHQAHASAYASLAPGKATGQPNATLLLNETAAAGTLSNELGSLSYLLGLENQMAETYAYALTTLTTPAIYQRVTATLPIESQHAAVFGTTLQLSPDGLFITGAFENAVVGDGSDVRRGFDMTVFPLG